MSMVRVEEKLRCPPTGRPQGRLPEGSGPLALQAMEVVKSVTEDWLFDFRFPQVKSVTKGWPSTSCLCTVRE